MRQKDSNFLLFLCPRKRNIIPFVLEESVPLVEGHAPRYMIYKSRSKCFLIISKVFIVCLGNNFNKIVF